MRITTTVHRLLVARLPEARTNNSDTSMLTLPACAEACIERIRCGPGEPCYCETNEAVQRALSTCVQDSCAELGVNAALNATFQEQTLRADACDFPSRDKSSVALGVSFALFGLASLSMLARNLSRYTLTSRRSFGMDDTALVLTYAVLVALAVSTFYAQRYGLGRNVWDVGGKDLELFLRWQFTGSIFYYAIVSGAKVTFALIFLRSWPGHTRHWFIVCCRFAIFGSIGLGISSILTTIFACLPISANWNLAFTQDERCAVNRGAAAYAFGGFDVLLNAVLLLLPVPKLLRHRSTGIQTLSVLVAYFFGLVVIVCSIGRLTAIAATEATSNPTWHLMSIDLWSLVECNCSIICSCLPALGSWLQRLRSNESSFCSVRLTGDDRPRWSLRRSLIQDQAAPFPNIASLRPSHSRQNLRGGLRSLRVQSPTCDEKSWRPSGETDVDRGTKPREHQMEAMVKLTSDVKFPRRAYTPNRVSERKTPRTVPTTGAMGYYFHGQNYVGREPNGRTPPTGPVTPILFNIDEEDVHSQLQSTSDLKLDRIP